MRIARSERQASGVDWPIARRPAYPDVRPAVAPRGGPRRWGGADDLYRRRSTPGIPAGRRSRSSASTCRCWCREGAGLQRPGATGWRRCAAQPPASRPDLVSFDDAPPRPDSGGSFRPSRSRSSAGDPDQRVASIGARTYRLLSRLAVDSDVLVAGTVYRGGARRRDARRSLLGRRWYAGLPVARGHYGPRHLPGSRRHRVVEFDDAVSQAAHLAARLQTPTVRASRGGTWRSGVRPGTDSALTRRLGQAHRFTCRPPTSHS
jgi:hypothetical protein